MTVAHGAPLLVPTGQPDERLPTVADGPRSFAWWGMVWFIAVEATLFALLLASYFYLRFRTGPVWPPDGIEAPKLKLVFIMSAILWSSSVPVHLAHSAIKRGHQKTLRVCLALGFVLGAAFLVLQCAVEYPDILRHEFTPRTDAYGSAFFTITGLHGAHVAVGLLMNAWVQMRARQGAFDRYRHVSVGNFVMYWHFVDVVWVFVLATLYLSPHL
ncbi:MAG TPA: cytochrome c oxidase subunit 3 [Acidimicrobiia bacterium]|nr:cytochrome c oxidase subunit 3 [Acidimicrobiia bacterium]